MANPEHLAILKQGVKAWNEWRGKNPGVHPDLSGLYKIELDLESDELITIDIIWERFQLKSPDNELAGINFSNTNLIGANLIGANLENADLRYASLSSAFLTGANLTGANLSDADVSHGELTLATLSQADLTRTSMVEADLDEADLTETILDATQFSAANMKNAKLTNAKIKLAMFRLANLTEAEMENLKLDGSIFFNADLTRANMRGSELRYTALNGAILEETDLTGANLFCVDLSGAKLIKTNLERSELDRCFIYGISAWKLKLDGAKQTNLLLLQPDDPVISVDNLEVAQLIYLLLSNYKIRNIINSVTAKVVLILGRFTTERKAVLDAIHKELRRYDYVPVLFDFDKPTSRDITETVRTLAHLARFIIADLTEPSSIPMELQAVVPDLAVPVQPLLLSGQQEFSMFHTLRKYPWVLPTYEYTDIADLLASLGDKVIAPAEQKAKEIEQGRVLR